ncbi:MAG: response regulator transcription factor [Tannerella sp.]|jgi:two-component system response regulator NreC|nr:response regulator transcription factor [Tannerella sp.]
MINVILVDDHVLFRIGIIGSLAGVYDDIRIVGEAGSGSELFKLLKTTEADVVLLDIMLPDMSGIEIARRLRAEYPLMKILVLSAENTADTVGALLDIGIEGFISKSSGRVNEIGEAVHSIMNGLEYFGKDISAIIYKVYVARKMNPVSSAPKPEFTPREIEIISLCRDGLLGKDIANRLFISPRTVNNHKKNIFEKLGLHSTGEVVRYALKNKIINFE